jgi:CRP-like cAMP-binding protein
MLIPHHSVLRQLPPFARLDEADINAILASAASYRYEAGSEVFEQGAEATRFSVLVHGRLRVTQVTPTGEQVVVRIVNPGDIFGIARALRRSTYPGTATAVVESIAISWPMAQWEPLVERYPAFAASAIRIIGERLLEAQARIREMSTEVVERRIGHTVLRLVQQSGVRETGGIRIDFPISKQDLAEMAGTTLHTVSRILTAWEQAGIVDTGRQKLTVRDPHRLLLIADGLEAGLVG